MLKAIKNAMLTWAKERDESRIKAAQAECHDIRNLAFGTPDGECTYAFRDTHGPCKGCRHNADS